MTKHLKYLTAIGIAALIIWVFAITSAVMALQVKDTPELQPLVTEGCTLQCTYNPQATFNPQSQKEGQ